MNSTTFKKYMYNLAMMGKLNTQNPDDEQALILLDTIIKDRKQLVKDKIIKKTNNETFIFHKNGDYYEKVGNNEPNCINDEISFEIPDSWVWCTLGNIASVKGGKRVPKGYKLLDEPTPHIYIRVTNMKNGTIIDNDVKYIDDEVYEKIKNYTISKNDLYITVAGTIGQIGSVPDLFDGMNLTENANKITDISVNKSFLKYLMTSDIVQSQLISKTTQVAQPKLAIKRITSVKIPLPPIKEQQRIVNILEKVDNYVNLDVQLSNLNKNFVEKFKEFILQEAVQGKLVPQDPNEEPASVLLEKIQEEKEKLIKAKKIKKNNKESTIYKENAHYYEKIGKKGEPVCIDEEIPFDIPDSWEWTRLGNIISISSGKNLTSKQMNDEYNVPVYGGNGITGYYTDFNISQKTLIIGRVGANCGNVHISTEKAWVTDNAFITTFPESCFDMKFLKYLLIYLNLRSYSSSTAQPVISGKKIYPILIPIVPLNEQKRIVNKIELLFNEVKMFIDE